MDLHRGGGAVGRWAVGRWAVDLQSAVELCCDNIISNKRWFCLFIFKGIICDNLASTRIHDG